MFEKWEKMAAIKSVASNRCDKTHVHPVKSTFPGQIGIYIYFTPPSSNLFASLLLNGPTLLNSVGQSAALRFIHSIRAPPTLGTSRQNIDVKLPFTSFTLALIPSLKLKVFLQMWYWTITFSLLHQLLQQATTTGNLGAFSGIQQMAGESTVKSQKSFLLENVEYHWVLFFLCLLLSCCQFPSLQIL